MTSPLTALTSPAVVGALAAGAAALALPTRVGARDACRDAAPPLAAARQGWARRFRPLLSLLAGAGALTLVGGAVGLLAAPVAVVACWIVVDRVEPADVRHRRELMRRDLPHLVRLLGAALAAGAAPERAVAAVADALPGPAGERLAGVAARLRLGADPAAVWQGLAAEPALAPLGRAMVRGHLAGTSVVASIERLADELGRAARAEAEDRARRVGVKAAVPLGLCLLPAFVLIGIVPLVGGLLTSLRL